MKLLIIRPQPGNDATAKRARAAGFEPVQLPLFVVEPVAWAAPDPAKYQALLITSANAIRHAGPTLERLGTLPVHAVGPHSARVASNAGMRIASTSASGVEEAIVAAAAAGHETLLWLAGEDRSAYTAPAGVRVDAMTVYRSAAVEPDDIARDTISQCDAVALHSVRAASHFAKCFDGWQLDRASMKIAAFSTAIAEAAGDGWAAMAVAAAPNDDALLSALSALGKQAPTGSNKE